MNVITRFYQLGRVSRFSIFCLFVLALMSINSFGQESVPVDASQIRSRVDSFRNFLINADHPRRSFHDSERNHEHARCHACF